MTKQEITRILIVDDHEMVRRGLAMTLAAFDDFELVGEASNGVEALEQCANLQPDVVLMDVIMPEMDGIAAAHAILEQYPTVKILALSTFKDENQVREMLEIGASGYLLKDISIDELANSIRTALTGRLIVSSDAARQLLSTPQAALSEREREVLALLVDGLTNVEIAERLVVARSTVKFHVSSILAKLNVTNRVEAVSVALQSGLIKR